MRITLSDHFTYQKLLRFTMPSIVMMIITSVYSIVDGFFVSNCVGKNAFAALNLIFPVLMALSAFGFMVGTGGSALIAKTLGEGKTKEANGIFSMLVAGAAAPLACGVTTKQARVEDRRALAHPARPRRIPPRRRPSRVTTGMANSTTYTLRTRPPMPSSAQRAAPSAGEMTKRKTPEYFLFQSPSVRPHRRWSE